ncbi:putative uncharacterized protein [Clostridium sp. CAG:768]|nr:putative uncharacterized protein [Clostridium sp. CAG:768]
MKILIAGLFIVLVGITTISSCNAFEINNYTNNQNAAIEVLDPIDKIEQDCISKTADTQEMNKCSQKAQQLWEKDINKNLAELKEILSAEDYKKLQLSQTSWENYIDKEYGFINSLTSYTQGTMYLNTKEGWRTEILKQRALTLRGYLNTLKK